MGTGVEGRRSDVTEHSTLSRRDRSTTVKTRYHVAIQPTRFQPTTTFYQTANLSLSLRSACRVQKEFNDCPDTDNWQRLLPKTWNVSRIKDERHEAPPIVVEWYSRKIGKTVKPTVALRHRPP